jgi:ABC-type glycerol-3-phosphate transport system permease component
VNKETMILKLVLRKRINRSWTVDILLFLLLGGVAAFMSLPLVYTINRAFMPLDEIFAFPPRFIVHNPTFKNFTDLVGIFSD